VVEQGTHKPLVGGSNPPSATTPSAPLDRLATLVLEGACALGVPDDAAIMLAVSGGPDSMALLHGAARAVGTDAAQWRLHVAHLDHGLRPESVDDAAFVADAARDLGLSCAVERVDVAAQGRRDGRSIEEAGRDARYAFLERAASEDAVIMTAHTADDDAETVLINLLRGTGLAGLAGIPPRRGRIVRPLLGVRRHELRALLDAAAVATREDPSNADPAFLRNRVRAEVLPALERLRPGAVERIGRFSRLAAADDALLDELAAAELARRRTDDGGIDWHAPPPDALGRRVLRLAIGHPAPAAERIEALLEATRGRGGVTVELGGGRTASVRGRVIRIGDG
jgi:tRNA(Ile)-lysidine synthase